MNPTRVPTQPLPVPPTARSAPTLELVPGCEALIERLVDGARTGRHAPLTGTCLGTARALLQQVVVDYDTLVAYLHRLGPAGAPRPAPTAEPPPAPTDRAAKTEAYRRQSAARREYQHQLVAIIEHGADAADPAHLPRILLDSLALYNLHQAIDHGTPDAWRDALHKNGTELRERFHVSPLNLRPGT